MRTPIKVRLTLTTLTVLLLGMALVTLLAYSSALDAGYIWDDDDYVHQNPLLRQWGGLWRIWFSPTELPQYYPLVHTSFWLEFRLWGARPEGYHVVNVLLHALNAWLLLRVLGRLRVPGALLAALLFALHPVHVESVAWITERKNVLSLVFYLLAFLSYLRFDKQRSWKIYSLSLALFLFALWSKTVTASLPAAILLVLWWKKDRITKRDVHPLIPFFALGLLMGLVTAWMERTHVGALGDEWSLTFLERCLLAGRIPWFYAWKLAWPAELTFIYPRWHVSASTWWQYLFPLATLGVIIALWYQRRRWGKGPLVAMLFFVGSLFPALGFFNVFPMRFSYVADHFQYLASIGLIALVIGAIVHLLSKVGLDKGAVAFGLFLVLLGALGKLTWEQCPIYKDQVTLWLDTLKKNPDAWIAHNNLGELFYYQGRSDLAEYHCREALKRKADLPEAHGNLANALYGKSRYEEALEHYEAMLELKIKPGKRARALTNMGAILLAMDRKDEAEQRHLESLEIEPDSPSTHHNLAEVYFKQRNYDQAEEQYLAALEIAPEFLQPNYRLAVLYEKTGRDKEAKTYFEKALELARASGQAKMVKEIEDWLKR